MRPFPLTRRALWGLALLLAGVAQARAGDAPMVELTTNRGVMLLELYPDKAPGTVANFLRYVADGSYADTLFHRIVPDFIVQGGGYGIDFTPRPTYDPIALESDNGLRHKPGSLSMARRDHPDSATRQFFIDLASNTYLNHRGETAPGYVVFGRVRKGYSVLRAIGRVRTGPGGPFPAEVPVDPVVIEGMRLMEAGP